MIQYPSLNTSFYSAKSFELTRLRHFSIRNSRRGQSPLNQTEKEVAKMEGFLDRVTTGRVFKDISGISCGRRRLRWELEPLDEGRSESIENDPQGGENAVTCDPEHVPEDTAEELSGSEVDWRSMQSCQYVDGQAETEVSTRPQSVCSADSASSKNPILTVPPLELVTLQENDGQISSAVTLSSQMAKQWNTILRCEHIINGHLVELEQLETTDADIALRIKTAMHGEDSRGEDQLDANANRIQDLIQYREDIEAERETLVSKIQLEEVALREPKTQLYRDWTNILTQANLLEPFGSDNTSIASGSQTPPVAPIAQATINELKRRIPQGRTPSPTPSVTPSEVAATIEERTHEVLHNFLHEKEVALHEAQRKLDNWDAYYDDMHQGWQEMVASRQISMSKSEFDVALLREAQKAAGDLIQAENNLSEAKHHAKTFGIFLEAPDQDSCFADYADDGYAESLEAVWINHVDKGWIQNWMSNNEGESGDPSKCDDWDARTVDVSDSVSVIANGKERCRIDRWRSTCQSLQSSLEKGT